MDTILDLIIPPHIPSFHEKIAVVLLLLIWFGSPPSTINNYLIPVALSI
jgi:hypothetical protein